MNPSATGGGGRGRNWVGTSVRRRLLDADLEAMSRGAPGRWLEIGNGRILRRGRFHLPAAGWVSLDQSARPRPHVRADAQRLPLADEAFDLVVCSEVGEYLPAPALAIAEIARVLKPGGRLVWATPFMHRADTETDRWRFTEAGLRQLLQAGGLHVLEVRAQGAALAVAANTLRFAVMAVPGRALRWAMAAAAYLPLRLLEAADPPAARAVPSLATFATGYAALARKPGRD
jgi:SAM-dependent methyltransferase